MPSQHDLYMEIVDNLWITTLVNTYTCIFIHASKTAQVSLSEHPDQSGYLPINPCLECSPRRFAVYAYSARFWPVFCN